MRGYIEEGQLFRDDVGSYLPLLNLVCHINIQIKINQTAHSSKYLCYGKALFFDLL